MKTVQIVLWLSLLAACSSTVHPGPPPFALSLEAMQMPTFIPRDRTIPMTISIRGTIENITPFPIEIDRMVIDRIRGVSLSVVSSSKMLQSHVDSGGEIPFEVPVTAYVPTSQDEERPTGLDGDRRFLARSAEVQGVIFLSSGASYPFTVRIPVE